MQMFSAPAVMCTQSKTMCTRVHKTLADETLFQAQCKVPLIIGDRNECKSQPVSSLTSGLITDGVRRGPCDQGGTV